MESKYTLAMADNTDVKSSNLQSDSSLDITPGNRANMLGSTLGGSWAFLLEEDA